MTVQPMTGDDTREEMERVLHRLASLHDGDAAVPELLRLGTCALPGLRALLFRRETSGIFEPRCRAAQALAAFGDHETLIAFLQSRAEAPDPVEAAGDAAVLNVAARELAGLREERIFRLLLDLAASRLLAGPIEVLGSWRRPEALPRLVAALADDLARPAAEKAIACYGRAAAPALLHAIRDPVRCDGTESESSRRKRREAVGLLMTLGLSDTVAPDLRATLMRDEDAALSVFGCRLALAHGTEAERRDAVDRSLAWFAHASWVLRAEIGDCLVAHAALSRPAVAAMLEKLPPLEADRSGATAACDMLLARIMRAESERESQT